MTDNTLQCHEINLLNLDNGIDVWHEINIRPRKCGKNDKRRINGLENSFEFSSGNLGLFLYGQLRAKRMCT